MNYSRYTTDPVSIVVLVILYLAVTFILSILFEKAGRRKLLAFIPFVNIGILFEIAGQPYSVADVCWAGGNVWRK